MKRKERNPKAVGAGRMFAWQSREVSQGCALMAVGYVSIFCTDTLKMDPALVGILLVISKLLDGFTDIIAGFIIDRTDTKWGRGRPYEVCIIGMWISTWLMSCADSILQFLLITISFTLSRIWLKAGTVKEYPEAFQFLLLQERWIRLEA